MTRDSYSYLRRQILEDVLGEKVEEYENFQKYKHSINKKKHRKLIPLWKFLFHLLFRDKSSAFVEWTVDHLLEFRIKDTNSVAELWGSMKNKTGMTYEKLGRAMRYYYGKNIIEKVSGKRYSYRFIISRRTSKYISQYIDIESMKHKLCAQKRQHSELSSSDSASICSATPSEDEDATLPNFTQSRQNFKRLNSKVTKTVKPIARSPTPIKKTFEVSHYNNKFKPLLQHSSLRLVKTKDDNLSAFSKPNSQVYRKNQNEDMKPSKYLKNHINTPKSKQPFHTYADNNSNDNDCRISNRMMSEVDTKDELKYSIISKDTDILKTARNDEDYFPLFDTDVHLKDFMEDGIKLEEEEKEKFEDESYSSLSIDSFCSDEFDMEFAFNFICKSNENSSLEKGGSKNHCKTSEISKGLQAKLQDDPFMGCDNLCYSEHERSGTFEWPPTVLLDE